jgi:hypothetical protein
MAASWPLLAGSLVSKGAKGATRPGIIAGSLERQFLILQDSARTGCRFTVHAAEEEANASAVWRFRA